MCQPPRGTEPWRQRNEVGKGHGPNIADEQQHQGKGSAGAG